MQIALFGCWAALFLGTVFRKRSPRAPEHRRGKNWSTGLVLQALSVGIVFALPSSRHTATLAATVGVVLAAASVALMLTAEYAMGRQFAYQARILENHRLITTGPFRFVRHPIYTGFLGLTLGTALAWSTLLAIPLFLPVFLLGTAIRIRAEERLLHAEFGEEFKEYARATPPLFPKLFGY